MKFLVSKSTLVDLVSLIQAIIPSKPVIPILSNILLESNMNKIVISATDLTVSLKVSGNAKVFEEGSVTLPAKHFFQLSKEITHDEIEITVTEEEIVYINSIYYMY